MNKLFRLSFKASIWGLLVTIAMGIVLACVEELHGSKKTEPFLIVFQISALFGALAWICGFILLWIEGWIYVFQEWHSRSWLVNLVFVFALVFFSFFAAYWFHILRGRLLDATQLDNHKRVTH